MKKLLIIFVAIIMLSGCGKDKYADFEHYDLAKYSHKVYTYTRDPDAAWYDLGNENYAVSSLSLDDDNVLGYMEGLFYEVGNNDYILLDSFMGCNNCYNYDIYTYLYNDKLYIVRNSGLSIYEYTLNKENTTKRELKFNYDLIFDNYKELNPERVLIGNKIDSVDDKYIYFKDVYFYNISNLAMNIKCSLDDLKCEEYKD